jgi:hypothetical protein
MSNPPQYTDIILGDSSPVSPSYNLSDSDSTNLLSEKRDSHATVVKDASLANVDDHECQRFGFVKNYRDMGMGVAFVMQFIAATAINFIGIVDLSSHIKGDGDGKSSETHSDNSRHPAAYIFPIAFVVSVAVALLLLHALRNRTHATTYAGLITPVALVGLLGAILLFASVPLGLTMLFICGVYGYLIYRWRTRVGFAVAMLETVTSVMKSYPSMFSASILAFVLQTSYFFYSLVGFIGFALFRFQGFHEEVDEFGNVTGFEMKFQSGTREALCFLILSMYWTLQFIPNALQVILSGVFASHFFSGGSTAQPNALHLSAKRALTTSFGSIAFGSLVIVIAQMIHSLILSRTQAFPFLHACCSCGLGFALAFIEFFTKYAFAHVAIYGKTYVSAAKDTGHLLKTSGVSLIINDNLIGVVMGSLTATVGIVSGYLGLLLSFVSVPPYRHYESCVDPTDTECNRRYMNVVSEIVSITFGCLLVGVIVMQVLLKVVDAGVATTFVIVAEERQVFKRGYPAFYEKLKTVYPNVAEQWTEDAL